MRRVFSICAVLVLSGCAVSVPEPEGERVHIKQVLRDTSGRPYECNNYDPETDSCEVISRRKVSGERIFYDVRFLMPPHPQRGGDPLPINLKAAFVIKGDRYCGNLSRSELKIEADLSPSDRSLMEELLIAGLVELGNVCGAYYRDDKGYVGVSETLDGQIAPDSIDRIAFFPRPKRLRLEP